MNNIYFTNAKDRLSEILVGFTGKVAVLVDENTETHCLPRIEKSLPQDFVLIKIKSGEINKNIHTCQVIWEALTNNTFHRSDILINLGGGVIGDMGGFCAATYKRGIRFITVPTTLLSQVDASVGGKLGIDFSGFKNQIGIFQNPAEVIIDKEFLKTLDDREVRSGYAEIIKHSLISSAIDWDQFIMLKIDDMDWETVIHQSVKVKYDVVEMDFREGGERKKLNFGHTIGHAIESYFMDTEFRLLHGEAIAAGMIMESWISTKLTGFTKDELMRVSEFIFGIYGKITFEKDQLGEILNLIKMDKKNKDNTILMTLLENIGSANFDNPVSEQLVSQSFDFYNSY